MDKRRKIYYPDGQISKGLYTNGGDWMFVDGTEYIGDYHKYSTGEVFTKSIWIADISKKLIPYVNLSLNDNSAKFKYDSIVIKPSVDTLNFAYYENTPPTEDDYNVGYFLRRFVKPHFQDVITEVSKGGYVLASLEFYSKVEIRWKLSGVSSSVSDVNRRQAQLGNETIKGLTNYITNYTEFLKT